MQFNTQRSCCGLDASFLEFPDAPLYNQSLQFDPAELASGKQIVKLLEQKLSTIQKAIKRLSVAESHIQTRLGTQADRIAPVHRIPEEVLLLVFQMAANLAPQAHVHQFNKRTQLHLAHDSRAPWSLAAVSRKWRALSLSSPSLWARVEHADLQTFENERLDEERVRLQLTRAGNLPLTLVIDESQDDDEYMSIAGEDLLEKNAQRIHELQLIFPSDNTGAPGDDASASVLNFENLQKLRISNVDMGWMDGNIFDNAPRLEHLSLEKAPVGRSFPSFVSWANLRSLQIENSAILSLASLLKALKSTSQLVFLKFVPDDPDSQRHGGDWDNDNLPSEVQLPLLKSLYLCFRMHEDVSRDLLSVIQTPRLERLHITYPAVDDLECVLKFIDSCQSLSGSGGSAASITAFSISSCITVGDEKLYSNTLVKIMQKLTSLRRLHFASPDGIFTLDPLIHELTAPISGQPLCQDLRELHLRVPNLFASPKSLQALVEARTRSPGNSGEDEGSTSLAAVYLEKVALSRDMEPWQESEDEEPHSRDRRNDPWKWLVDAHHARLVKYSAVVDSWDDEVQLD